MKATEFTETNGIITFGTGAVRSSKRGKGRYDLIPPECLRRIAQMYERGLQNSGGETVHAERNWERGIPISVFYGSAMRHLLDLGEGRTNEDHAAQLVFNVFGIMEMVRRVKLGELPAELLDLPGYTGATKEGNHAALSGGGDSGGGTGAADGTGVQAAGASGHAGACNDKTRNPYRLGSREYFDSIRNQSIIRP